LKNYLNFLAGKKALQNIKAEGLTPDMVKVVAGAAGGPRGLVLSQLDRALFCHWFTGREAPLFLLGSSIGAWRFAAAAQKEPEQALDRLETAFIKQKYRVNSKREEISLEGMKLIETLLGDRGTEEILNHPYLRLSVLAARSKWPFALENRFFLSLGMMDAAIYNAVHRTGLKFFFERALFYDQRELPPFFHMDGFSLCRVPLARENLKPALLATASLPMFMTGVKDIPGAPRGTYRDGGLIDFHLDISLLRDQDGIVLFPHYAEGITPGWFDTKLLWRRHGAANVDNVLLVTPTREFVERLPLGKIPSIRDFFFFLGRDKERISYWQKVVSEGKRLGDEFLQAVETKKIRDLVKPMYETG
jgi:hypothetical protein